MEMFHSYCQNQDLGHLMAQSWGEEVEMWVAWILWPCYREGCVQVHSLAVLSQQHLNAYSYVSWGRKYSRARVKEAGTELAVA